MHFITFKKQELLHTHCKVLTYITYYLTLHRHCILHYQTLLHYLVSYLITLHTT